MSNAAKNLQKTQAADSLADLAIQLAVGREYRTLRYLSDSLVRRLVSLPAGGLAREVDPIILAFSGFILDSMFDDEQARRTINKLIGSLVALRVTKVHRGLERIESLVFENLVPRFMTASKTADAKTIIRAAEGVVELPRILSGFILAQDQGRFKRLSDVLPTLFHDELKNRCYAQFQLAAANLIDALSIWQQMGSAKAKFAADVEYLLRAMTSVQSILFETQKESETIGPLADNILAVLRTLVQIEYAERMSPVALDTLKSEYKALADKPSLRSHLLADLESHASLAAQQADPAVFSAVLGYWSRAGTGVHDDLSLRFAGVVAQIRGRPSQLDAAIRFALEEYRFLADGPVEDFHPRIYKYPVFITAVGIDKKATFPEGFNDLIKAVLQRLQRLREPAREDFRKNVQVLWRSMIEATISDQDYDKIWQKIISFGG
jgi:hypothetical protein